MKTMVYDNELYWKCTGISAIRPHEEDRVKVLTIHGDGSITVKNRTETWLRQMAVEEFRKRGLMA